MTDLRYYIMLATDSGAYKDIELEIMKEALLEWERRPDSRATLVELASGGRITGFAYFTPVTGTEFTWEIKWLVVDRQGQREDIGHRLLDQIESEILAGCQDAILLVETSAIKEKSIAEGFWQGAGFALIGRIPAFYGKEDDYLMYSAHVSTHQDEEEAAPEAGNPSTPAPEPQAAPETPPAPDTPAKN